VVPSHEIELRRRGSGQVVVHRGSRALPQHAPGLLDRAGAAQSKMGQGHVEHGKVGCVLEDPSIETLGLVMVPQELLRERRRKDVIRIHRIQDGQFGEVLQCLLHPALAPENEGEPRKALDVVRLELQSPLEVALGLAQIPSALVEEHAQGIVALRETGVIPERPFGGLPGPLEPFVGGIVAVEPQLGVGDGQLGPRLGKGTVTSHRLQVRRLGEPESRFVLAEAEEIVAAQIEAVCFQVGGGGGAPGGPFHVACGQPQGLCHLLGQGGLEAEELDHRMIEGPPPDHAVVRDPDEFRGDDHAAGGVRGSLETSASGQDEGNAQFGADLPVAAPRPPELHRTAVGDHGEPRQARQVGMYPVGDAVREVLLTLRSDVVERQDRNGEWRSLVRHRSGGGESGDGTSSPAIPTAVPSAAARIANIPLRRRTKMPIR
jgi:hypothetical protein